MGWHLAQLDALRGIAILGVIVVHCSLSFGAREEVIEIAHWGQRGVQLFYIASAFTLFLSEQNRRSEQKPLRNFFIRRFFRLAPMFYAATLLAFFVFPQNFTNRFYSTLSIFFFTG